MLPVAAAPGTPVASIIVVVHDNLVFSRLCLEGVLASTTAPAFEVVVVDNASSDGTAEYLVELARLDGRVRVIRNLRNAGFSAGTNIGLAASAGRLVVLLNNDTIVAPGWLEGLARHVDDAGVGMVGPVTNNAPDQSRVADSCETYGDFLAAAARRLSRPGGRDVDGLTMFCVALRREVVDSIGVLDERYEVGMFEDDDYCARLQAAGFRLRVADDILVHHFGEASFGKLVPSGEWNDIFRANRRRFEQKWGRPWAGHTASNDAKYLAMIDRFRTVVAAALPPGTRVLVASRGDDRLCALDGRVGGHFPMLADGGYAGSYPAGDGEAIVQVTALRAQGWTHLALPTPAMWWLEHYPGWRDHLVRDGDVIADDPETCVVFRLPEAAPAGGSR